MGPEKMVVVSHSMIRMTHPSRNFFVLSLFVWLRPHSFESLVNKDFFKENGILIQMN
jgi:hypothetical protein